MVCLNGAHTNEGYGLVRPLYAYFDLHQLKSLLPFTPLQGFRAVAPSAHLATLIALKLEPAAALAEGERRDAQLIIRNLTSSTDSGFASCDAPEGASLPRNWSLLPMRKELQWVISNITLQMNNSNYDVVHVRRGDKVLDSKRWPNLDKDTRPDSLLKRLLELIQPGRFLYISTDERSPGFFDPLREKFNVRMLGDFKDLWGPGSAWYQDYSDMLGKDVTFDSYMEVCCAVVCGLMQLCAVECGDVVLRLVTCCWGISRTYGRRVARGIRPTRTCWGRMSHSTRIWRYAVRWCAVLCGGAQRWAVVCGVEARSMMLRDFKDLWAPGSTWYQARHMLLGDFKDLWAPGSAWHQVYSDMLRKDVTFDSYMEARHTLLKDFKDLWAPGSAWYQVFSDMLGKDVTFDSYMEVCCGVVCTDVRLCAMMCGGVRWCAVEARHMLLGDFKELWAPGSAWYQVYSDMLGKDVTFDSYMEWWYLFYACHMLLKDFKVVGCPFTPLLPVLHLSSTSPPSLIHPGNGGLRSYKAGSGGH
ncbi:unnamed protein product [Closterium sp. Yama58-4]|nr:unnamed protein product [Closterium sp. Yama58-4]